MGKKQVTYETRQQILGLLRDKNKSNVEIARLVGVSEKCVRTTRKNFEKDNVAGELPRSGRPNKLSPRAKNWIYRQVRKNPTMSCRRLADEFNSTFQEVSICRESVRKTLLDKEIGTYVSPKKPLLTKKHKKNRYEWCKERLHWDVEKWSRVIFSDESNFEVINRKSKVLIKRHRWEQYQDRFCQPRVQGGGGSIGIWGCISHKGTGVCQVYTGRINQHSYKETLENALLPSKEIMYSPEQAWIFQQDGASAHTAKSVKSWFDEQDITCIPWPSRSPDLNPIENIWSIIDANLVTSKLTSPEELSAELETLWLSITRETCMSLVESMPRRVKACYSAKGGFFKA